jgi:hypothetical protein
MKTNPSPTMAAPATQQRTPMKTRILLFTGLALALGIAFTTSAQAAIPSDGLVANYPFNGNANDVSGNGNNGLVFGATLTSDRFGTPDSAYHFGGSGDYVFIAASPSLNITGDLTIAAWVYLSSSSVDPNAVIFSNLLEISPHNGYAFRLWDSNKLRFFSGDQSLLATTPLDAELWAHVAVVLSGATATTYINGTLDSSGTVAVPTSSSVNPTIGASQERFYGWNGGIDDILVYNRALSPVEISELAQVPEPSTYALLIAGAALVLVTRRRRATNAASFNL